MKTPRKIELLSPAKDLECGLAAIDHGADAIYIGAPRFGARAAASNSLEEIGTLVNRAHLYGVRIYVTLNTILHDHELPEAEKMIWDLYRIGVDALIIQDMGLTCLHLPPIPLHASTQTDNRTPEKVRFLTEAGFRQVVLARELTLQEIRTIHHEVPQANLEVFVHGALCVSYSGLCYASQYRFGRSANRGVCAQFCRLPFNMVDADGRTIVRDKHLLSLKDMNRIDHLEELLDAGVTSFKIEGRLKDAAYVKNITAAYRQTLDRIFDRRPEYTRASSGHVTFHFTPAPEKSFNRGFTSYLLHGKEAEEIASPHTPKSLGEPMGTLLAQYADHLVVSGTKPFHNGDGLCCLDAQGRLQGFRINRVEGQRLYPAISLPRLPLHTPLYRNFDHEFDRQLQRPHTAERRILIDWQLWETSTGYALQATDEEGHRAACAFPCTKEEALRPQSDYIRTQLGKLGDTLFALGPQGIRLHLQADRFIPASQLSAWRRRVIDLLEQVRRISYPRETATLTPTVHPLGAETLPYTANVLNRSAALFYRRHGVTQITPAFEQASPANAPLMYCNHCLRYTLGWCPQRQGTRSPYREPYYLVGDDGHRYRLVFDCKACLMMVMPS